MIGHYIDKCRGCDKVMGQCRCFDNNKEIRWGICDECLDIVKRERDSIVKESIAKFRKVTVDTMSGNSCSIWYNNEGTNGPWFSSETWSTGAYKCDGTLYGLLITIRANIISDHVMRKMLDLQEDPYEA